MAENLSVVTRKSQVGRITHWTGSHTRNVVWSVHDVLYLTDRDILPAYSCVLVLSVRRGQRERVKERREGEYETRPVRGVYFKLDTSHHNASQ